MVIAKGLEQKGTKRSSEEIILPFGLSRESFLKEVASGLLTGLLQAL